jgi:hypothetical protein
MVNCARLLHHGSPSAEDNEVWDATHVEPSRQFWIVLRVDLYNDRFPGHIGSRARHLGRRHPAGSAPFSPKVREHRNTGISDDFVERFTINFQGLIHWRQGALQAPQRPASARWAAGMRFFLPQVLHVRITDIHILQLRTCSGPMPLVVARREIANPIPCFRRSVPASIYDRGESAWPLQRRNFVMYGSSVVAGQILSSFFGDHGSFVIRGPATARIASIESQIRIVMNSTSSPTFLRSR